MLSAIITAAGKSVRFGKENKQLTKIDGQYLFIHSINKMKAAGANEIILVIGKDDKEKVDCIVNNLNLNCKVIIGGNSRQKSVALGFKKCTPDDDLVIVHDCARPFVNLVDIKKVIDKANKFGAAILACPVTDTVKKVKEDLIIDTLDREELYLAQTPQVFKKTLFAKTSFIEDKVTDDAYLFEKYGFPVHIVKGSSTNIKITYKDDLKYAEFLAHEGLL